MHERPDNILSYAAKHRGPAQFLAFTRRHRTLLAILTVLLALGLLFLYGPYYGQIRLDTGDLRYCWCGIPIRYVPMPEPLRSKIAALASASPAIPAQWVTCVTYPLEGTNNPDGMCRIFYECIAIWADADPRIARWSMDDVVTYLRDTHAQTGLPKSCLIFSDPVIDWPTRTLAANWRDHEEVQLYCSAHGYTPPLPPTASPTQ